LMESSFYARCLFKGLLVHGSWYRVGSRSICQFWTLFNQIDAHSSSFFITWFRARIRVRWVALVRNNCFVRINLGWSTGFYYHDLFPFGLHMGQVLCPPSLCICYFYLIHVSFRLKKKNPINHSFTYQK